jgi:hypothetical protein
MKNTLITLLSATMSSAEDDAVAANDDRWLFFHWAMK